MKKIFAILMAICMLASVLCVPALAAEEPIVIKIQALKDDGNLIHLESHTDFVKGWSAAMTMADSEKFMKENKYDRIVVDLCANWTASGVFSSSGKGFEEGALYIEPDVRMTINLGGYTINRGLTECTSDGEVIYIGADADVIINNGTITGGFSSNGAGGIHIDDDARVTMNRVNVVGNAVEDDDGGGIAVYDGATLTMNGGCVSNNRLINDFYSDCCGGGVYVEDSYAYFYDVDFVNNSKIDGYGYGVALYSDQSELVFEDCEFVNNGLTDKTIGSDAAESIVYLYYGNAVFRRCFFNGNGTRTDEDLSSVISVHKAWLTLQTCNFKENKQTFQLYAEGADVEANDTDFTGNQGLVLRYTTSLEGTFVNCKFDEGTPNDKYKHTFDNNDVMRRSLNNLYLIDCQLGGATFLDRHNVTVKNNRLSTIFSEEGSLAMIVAFVALIASVASIIVNASANKKRAVSKAANDAENAEN